MQFASSKALGSDDSQRGVNATHPQAPDGTTYQIPSTSESIRFTFAEPIDSPSSAINVLRHARIETEDFVTHFGADVLVPDLLYILEEKRAYIRIEGYAREQPPKFKYGLLRDIIKGYNEVYRDQRSTHGGLWTSESIVAYDDSVTPLQTLLRGSLKILPSSAIS